MHAEITTTLAGAAFVLAVAGASGTLPAKPPSSPLQAAAKAQGIDRPSRTVFGDASPDGPAAAPQTVSAATSAATSADISTAISTAASAAIFPASPVPGLRRDLPPVPSASPHAPLDGLAAGYIISADNLVFGSAAADSHSVTVQPADPDREFKARVLGMPVPRGAAIASRDGGCGRADRTRAAKAPALTT